MLERIPFLLKASSFPSGEVLPRIGRNNRILFRLNEIFQSAAREKLPPQRVSSILLYSGLEIYSSLVDMSYPPFRASFSFSFSFSLSRKKIIESMIRYQLWIKFDFGTRERLYHVCSLLKNNRETERRGSGQ